MERRADIIVANRAYLDHNDPPDSGAAESASNGGLLAAVRPVIAPWEQGDGTTWIGAGRGRYDEKYTGPGGLEFLETPRGALRHQRLFFDDATWGYHYAEVANSFLWPLLHLVRVPLPEVAAYYPAPRLPSDAEWAAYRRVNHAFAVAAQAQPIRGTAWVHDYQLALVPELLRREGFPGRIGFFLHTPFPDLAVASRFLDARARMQFAEFVHGILGASVAGFQSEGDADRFIAAAVALCGAEPVAAGLRVDGRTVRVDAYPVGIDSDETLEAARSGTVPDDIVAAITPGAPLVIGLERSDFTKGIPERLAAIAASYRCGVRFTYVGIAAPTREGVAAYEKLDAAIDAGVADADRAARACGSTFLQLHRSIPWESVIALQREADVVFTSSLADGMNLVPLQAVAAQSLRPAAERGVILAGMDAGVSWAFAGYTGDGLVPVDPFDDKQMRATLSDAVQGKLPRISDRLVAAVRDASAQSWATQFLADLGDAEC